MKADPDPDLDREAIPDPVKEVEVEAAVGHAHHILDQDPDQDLSVGGGHQVDQDQGIVAQDLKANRSQGRSQGVNLGQEVNQHPDRLGNAMLHEVTVDPEADPNQEVVHDHVRNQQVLGTKQCLYSTTHFIPLKDDVQMRA